MISTYVQAMSGSLSSAMEWLMRLALPLSLLLGLAALAAGVSVVIQRENAWVNKVDWNRIGASGLGVAGLGFALVACWGALGATASLAREDAAWRDKAEATANPVPDAPAVYQYGPAAASLVERTYKRTLNLPPDFIQRIGTQGAGALAPYLADPSDVNVLSMADDFQQNGQNVLLTREVKRIDEEPIPLSRSNVRVEFRRLGTRAYDALFQGIYTVQNRKDTAINARISLPVPQAGTVRDLSVRVGNEAVAEPGPSAAYEWKGTMQPGETRDVDIRYRVVGARSWHYDLGSLRRRVEQFHLEAVPNGPARFLRGSLQPTAKPGKSLRWDLTNVITAQQVAIALPPDTEAAESFIQGLNALPVTLVLYVIGAIVVGYRLRRMPGAGRLTAGVLLFAFGLGSAVVLANYVGSVAAIIIGPVAGALLAGPYLGVRSLPALLPVALLPAAFLSPTHSGAIVLILALIALGGLRITAKNRGS
jgi:hypothetical protein